mmetsp:Transcript_124132/g.358963  ORF Transcript_124132/g.358963 Transcript_124132/m.358963 type:complete len:242 (+) Transcript_124132:175-900(+)
MPLQGLGDLPPCRAMQGALAHRGEAQSDEIAQVPLCDVKRLAPLDGDSATQLGAHLWLLHGGLQLTLHSLDLLNTFSFPAHRDLGCQPRHFAQGCHQLAGYGQGLVRWLNREFHARPYSLHLELDLDLEGFASADGHAREHHPPQQGLEGPPPFQALVDQVAQPGGEPGLWQNDLLAEGHAQVDDTVLGQGGTGDLAADVAVRQACLIQDLEGLRAQRPAGGVAREARPHSGQALGAPSPA